MNATVELPHGQRLHRGGFVRGVRLAPQPVTFRGRVQVRNTTVESVTTEIRRLEFSDQGDCPVQDVPDRAVVQTVPTLESSAPLISFTPKKQPFYVIDVKKPRDYKFEPSLSRSEHIQYFRELVNEEIEYMMKLADHYEHVLKTQGPESGSRRMGQEVIEAILSAVGLSRLLVSKKIQQFIGLISDCENENGEIPTDPSDLAGFWEMLNMQVTEIHKRFEALDELARNDWKTPAKVAVEAREVAHKKAQPHSKNAGTRASVQASSKIRDAIAAARRQKKEEAPSVTVDAET